jgi:hypothetical protein
MIFLKVKGSEASELPLTDRACCCAGIQSSFRPDVAPNGEPKAEDNYKKPIFVLLLEPKLIENYSRLYSVSQR